jgi:hypothetical protein
MRYSAIRFRISLALCVLWIGLGGLVAWGQTPPSALPANWQQLSPSDFATLAQGYYQQGAFPTLGPVDQFNLQSQAATLFSQVNISSTSLTYQTLRVFAEVGQPQLDQWTLALARRSIAARHDDWSGKPYSEMFAKVMLMADLDLPNSVSTSEARRWALAGGTADQVPQNDWVYDFVRHMFADFDVLDQSFSVTWVGQINAPQSGDYTFSISPIDVNMGYSHTWATTSMSVSIAGQEIITAGPPSSQTGTPPGYQPGTTPTSKWVAQSSPVTLTAGTPVSIQVTFSVNTPPIFPPGTLHAILLWQGPGITRQPVPASAVSQAQTGTPGFQATYSWTMNGQQQSLTRTDPVIDFAWTSRSLLLAKDPTGANQAAESMWQTMTSASFISSCTTATPIKLHPFLREPEEASCGQSSGRRQAFLDLLIQNPALLDAMDADHAVRFFRAFRIGATDKALSVFGTWAVRRANLVCVLGNQPFDGETRQALAEMAILVTQQLPQQAPILQQEFLQLPDGRCSLPVAYILTYSQLGLGKLNDWIASLDAKLADPTVAGDLRVNWLLARAHAQEFTRTAPIHYPLDGSYPSSWPEDGLRYLYQALNAAQTPSVKVRVAKEIAAQITAGGEYQRATDFLGQVASSQPDAEKALVTAWQQEIAGLVAVQPLALQSQQAESSKGYLMTLRARRARAASQGNSAAVSRYDALISAASSHQ